MNNVGLLRELPVPLRDGTVTRAGGLGARRPPDPATLVRTPYLKETAVPSPLPISSRL